MANRAMGTLSPRGWLKDGDVAERADKLMAYAFQSDHSQSVSFSNKVMSIQWIISKYYNDRLDLQSKLQENLDQYLNANFDRVEVEVKVTENGSEYNIDMSALINNAGQSYQLSRLLTTRNADLVKVTNALNGEELDFS